MKYLRCLIIVLFAGVVACSMAPALGQKPADPENPRFVDGEYTGWYRSFPNSAKVKVKIEDGRITEVVVERHISSQRGAPALDPIPKAIVEQQSTDVDVIAGATNSSRVIMNAVEDALTQARPKS